MIIPIDPEEYDYGNDCLLCYALDKTPANVYIAFSNIKRGNLWGPGDPDPPNEMYKLPQTTPCRNHLDILPLTFDYNRTAFATNLTVQHAPVQFVFLSAPGVICETNFVNGFQNPAGVKYYGGEASVFWVEPYGTSSLATLAENFGIPQNEQTTALVYPIQPEKQVVKLQNFTENIKISIKRDFA